MPYLLVTAEAVLIVIAGGTMVWERLACLVCFACEAVGWFV